MLTLNKLNYSISDILLSNVNSPAQECNLTLPVVSGKSAYDLAVENGYVGSLQNWLLSLSGWKPIDSDFTDYLEQQLEHSTILNSINSKIEANKVELDTRIAERISEAQAITEQLKNEVTSRVAESKQLIQSLLDETKNRIKSIEQLVNDTQSESFIRTGEIEQLFTDIEFEQVNRVAEITSLKNNAIDLEKTIVEINNQVNEVENLLDTKVNLSDLQNLTDTISELGDLSKVDKLTSENISTYVEGLAVKNLLVSNAQITSDNIANQAVSVTSAIKQTVPFDVQLSAFSDAIYMNTEGCSVSVEFTLISCNLIGSGGFVIECFINDVPQDAWTIADMSGNYPSMVFPFLVSSSNLDTTKIQIKVTSNNTKVMSSGYFLKATVLKR